MPAPANHPDSRYVSLSLHYAKLRIKAAEAASALLTMAAYALLALTAVVIADHIRPDGLASTTRTVFRYGFLGGMALLFVWLVVLPGLRRIGNLYAARAIERRHPEFRNSLISAVELAWRNELPGSMRAAVASRAAGDLSVSHPWASIDRKTLRWSCLFALASIGVFAVYALLAPKPVWPSIRRAFGSPLPPPTRSQIVIEEPPEDYTTLVGEPVRLVALVTGRRPQQAYVRFSIDGGLTWLREHRVDLNPPPTVKTVDPRERQRWRGVKPAQDVRQTMHYQFVAGDAVSELRELRVRPYPTVADVSVRLEPPDYTGLSPEELEDGHMDTVVGTLATVALRTSTPAGTPPALVFRKPTNRRVRTLEANDRATRFSVQFRVEHDDEYTVDFRDRFDVRNRDPVVYSIRARPDRPPTIELERPDDGITLRPDQPLPLACRASDDFGLTQVILQTEIGPRTTRIALFDSTDGTSRSVDVERDIPLASLKARVGDRVTWWIVAADNRHDPRGHLDPQISESEKRTFLVREPATLQGSDDRASTRPSERRGRTDRDNAQVSDQSTTDDTATEQSPDAANGATSQPTTEPSTEEDLERFVQEHERQLEKLRKLMAERRAGKEPDDAARRDPAGERVPADEGDQAVADKDGKQGATQTAANTQHATDRDARRGDPDAMRDPTNPQAAGEVERAPDGTTTRPESGRPQDDAAADRGQEAETESAPDGTEAGEPGPDQTATDEGEGDANQEEPGEGEGASDQPGSGQGESTTSDGQQEGRSDQGEQASDQAQPGQAPSQAPGEGGSSESAEGTSSESSGQGESAGEAPGEGSGQGQSEGEGSGQGSSESKGSSGQGSGKESGQGEGTGEGSGEGEGEGTGQGEGAGKGSGQGEGASESQGQGEGAGQGKGQGSGKGEGSGEGEGSSEGEGSGQGKGSEGSQQGGGTSLNGGISSGQIPQGDTPAESPTTRPDLDATDIPAAGDRSAGPRSQTERIDELVNELERQLRSGEPDPDLLKELNWTPEQANDFVRAYRRIREREQRFREGPSDARTNPRSIRTATSQPGDATLRQAQGRGAGLRGARILDRREADKIRRLREVRRQQVPPSYRRLLDAYYRTLATSSPDGATTQPTR